MMLKSKNRKLVNELARNLYYIGIDEEYYDRARVVLHVYDLIRKIGTDIDTFFEMDVRYTVTEYTKFKSYKDRLLDIIDIQSQSERMRAASDFYEWLHEIKLLRNY